MDGLRPVTAGATSGLAILVVAALSACSLLSPSAVDTQGAFRLTFSLPQATYDASEEINGIATLAVTNGKSATIAGSGNGPLGFSFDEVGGTRHMDAVWRESCRRYEVEPGSPITSAIKKSAGWSAEDPNAAFYQAFIEDPQVHLPPGTWDISAVASFSEGDCSSTVRVQHLMTAKIRITVTP